MIKDKLTICLIVPRHSFFQMGGAQYRVKCLTEALIANGDYEVHVLSRGVSDKMRDAKYQLHNILEGTGLGKYAFFWDTFQLRSCLRRIEPDVIYQRVGSAHTGIAASYSRRHD